jgi:ribosome maturation factor RimP
VSGLAHYQQFPTLELCYTGFDGRTIGVGGSPLFYWPRLDLDASLKTDTIPAASKLSRSETIARVTAIAEAAASPAGIEVVEVELKGSGRHHLLRLYIDRPEGVSHADCELVSRAVSNALDAEDPIPGSYELEVSSPGVERNLTKWQDWLRFCGSKAKVVLREPVHPVAPADTDVASGKKRNFAKRTGGDLKSFDGKILQAENRTVTVELADGAIVTFPIEMVDHANLKFEW